MYCDFKIKSTCKHETRYRKSCRILQPFFCDVRAEAERVRKHKVALVREGFIRQVGLKGLRF